MLCSATPGSLPATQGQRWAGKTDLILRVIELLESQDIEERL